MRGWYRQASGTFCRRLDNAATLTLVVVLRCRLSSGWLDAGGRTAGRVMSKSGRSGDTGEFVVLANALRDFITGPLSSRPSDRGLAKAAGVSATTAERGGLLDDDRWRAEFGVRTRVAAVARRGGFVLLVGGSSEDKPRSGPRAPLSARQQSRWRLFPAAEAGRAELDAGKRAS
jgi:hypothetical protein